MFCIRLAMLLPKSRKLSDCHLRFTVVRHALVENDRKPIGKSLVSGALVTSVSRKGNVCGRRLDRTKSFKRAKLSMAFKFPEILAP